ncbi:MAG TPA: hydroxymethylbilane synthase [Gammaproteobacteria bacterium]
MKLALGTRGSELALMQSGTVADRLRAAGHTVEIVPIRTAGDRSQAPSFGSIGAQGVFVREIEEALLDGRVDLAVHSFKDLPTASPQGLAIGAIPLRADAADVLLVRADACLLPSRRDEGSSAAAARASAGAPESAGAAPRETADVGLALCRGARVGTSSVRRAAWLRHFRPDVAALPLRGNVPTRIRKLRAGDYDAIVLAAAGIARLGEALDEWLPDIVAVRLDPRRFVPAPAQGALAVQCRADDAPVRALLASIDDPSTRAAVTIERDALARAEGGCNTAFGAYCVAAEDGFALTAMLERAGRIVTVDAAGETPEAVGAELWRRIEAEE